jgi:hypothetical protein
LLTRVHIYDVRPASNVRFPLPRLMLSSIRACACPMCALRFPQERLFVLRHPGGPAYGTCTRAVALYPFRLARGYTPSNPARPSVRRLRAG